MTSRGFICETYSIQSGGATLSLHRIVNPLANQETLNKYPVLYGHGVLYDSGSMMSRSEHSRPRKPTIGQASVKYPDAYDDTDDYSLPFMFSNNNFDVYMFDGRGVNDHSRNLSAQINPVEADKFWDFGLDDQALVDVPNLMNFVLTRTAANKLVYVGYSESTFFMFALMTQRPETADKVAAFIALAPVAYVGHIQGLTLPMLAPIAALTPDSFHYSFMPQPLIDTVDISLRNLCQVQPISSLICGSLIKGIGGDGEGKMQPGFFREFFKSTSLKAFKQFLQLFVTKRFSKYDYGAPINMRVYGQEKAPDYELGRIKSDRIILVRGLADFLSDPIDQEQLIAELGSKPYLDIAIPKYNHFDFIDGEQLIEQVNHPVMVAVYQLLYKDGPNIIRTPEQNKQIASIAATSPPDRPNGQEVSQVANPQANILSAIEPMIERPFQLLSNLVPGIG